MIQSIACNRKRRILIHQSAWLSASIAYLGIGRAHAQNVMGAEEFIARITDNVIEGIRQDKQIQDGDTQRINAFVEALIFPNINLERLTSLAVGKSWRQANVEQQQLLIKQFRTLLLRTYSGALANAKDSLVRVKPARPNNSEDEVIVKSEVLVPRREPIQLDYRVEKSAAGWKIYDINILGVWLVETYRAQFTNEISMRGIDGLILSLTEKNRNTPVFKNL